MKTPIPKMSIVYFILAAVWLLAAVSVYGQTLFILFIVVALVNVFAGVRMIKK
ncbi:hypothetical protein [Domibacillus aminovorans]|uniref:hypothetical protein n=1 Tax=Domibacillus aminovorans TaxID=29332 RepID=UPI000B2FE354|nr:hypothetical protein [Domibacillus aminovorans]